jgi:dihydrodipicolinate synthase/N-acetylneuraminate lyase
LHLSSFKRNSPSDCGNYRPLFAGDIKGSAELQFKYFPLIKALFCEVNPIPVKAAMAALGFCEIT